MTNATQTTAKAKDPGAKGWIPTHDGYRDDRVIRDPYIRNSDSAGPIKPYLPWFTSKCEANAWCRKVDAVAVSCEYSEAVRIAKLHGAELVVS